jgi:hypothetical protein
LAAALAIIGLSPPKQLIGGAVFAINDPAGVLWRVAQANLMKQGQSRLEFAVEVFVRGHSAVKSRTHPYDVRLR